MKKFNSGAVLAGISVLTILLFLSSCTTDRSFYSTRVVDRKDHKTFSLALSHRLKAKNDFARNRQVEILENALVQSNQISVTDPVAVATPATSPAVDIASVDNKLFVNPVNERLSKRISDLYKSETDVKSFRKAYKEIKKEQVAKFVKRVNKTAEPIIQNVPNADKPGFSIASFVLSIVGLIVAAIPCGLLAIIFGAVGMKKGMKGLAIAGLIIGIVDVVLGLLIVSSM